MWRFEPVKGGEVESDPTEEEFFSNEDVDRVDSLVRETIQNSLDARREDNEGPVRVRFAFPGPEEALPPETAAAYRDGLIPHLRAAGLLPMDFDQARPMAYLLVEDFGTTGLDGETGQSEARARQMGRRSNFYDFWRRKGQSNKGGAERGRWGLGKWVFPGSSRLRAFFGLTVRQDDGRELLMGQAVVKSHALDGRLYHPYGFYARHETDGFQQPIQDAKVLADFRRHFRLGRGTETGLSLVIPCPHEEFGPQGILRAAILHYFYPILAGKLVVQVHAGGTTHELSAATLSEAATRISELKDRGIPEPLFGFVGAAWAIPQDDYLRLQLPGDGKAPEWGERLFDAGRLEGLRDRFAKGELIALRVPVVIRPRGRPFQESHFDLFVRRDPARPKGLDCYIRNGLTVHGIRQLGGQSVVGLFLAEEGVISQFLGDSENPAHLRWNERNERFKAKYDVAVGTLRFVKNSLREVVGILARPAEGRDPDLLAHIFYVQEPARSAGGPPGPAPVPPLPPEDRPFRIQRIGGGFRVSRDPQAGTALATGRVRVAYQVRGANPFRRYDRRDFDLSRPPIQVAPTGARILVQDGNVLEFAVERPDFAVSVTGFDRRRDLSVSVEPLPEPA